GNTTRASARALRAVTALSVTFTMRGWPWSSIWESVDVFMFLKWVQQLYFADIPLCVDGLMSTRFPPADNIRVRKTTPRTVKHRFYTSSHPRAVLPQTRHFPPARVKR